METAETSDSTFDAVKGDAVQEYNNVKNKDMLSDYPFIEQKVNGMSLREHKKAKGENELPIKRDSKGKRVSSKKHGSPFKFKFASRNTLFKRRRFLNRRPNERRTVAKGWTATKLDRYKVVTKTDANPGESFKLPEFQQISTARTNNVKLNSETKRKEYSSPNRALRSLQFPGFKMVVQTIKGKSISLNTHNKTFEEGPSVASNNKQDKSINGATDFSGFKVVINEGKTTKKQPLIHLPETISQHRMYKRDSKKSHGAKHDVEFGGYKIISD